MFIIGYDKSIKKMLNACPDEIYINDFDDGYHRVDEDGTDTPTINIKQFYRNIPDYIVARNKYDDYMETLAQKEISPDVFKILKKAEAIQDYIPPKPRIKNSRESRILYKMEKRGEIISKVKNNEGMTRDELKRYKDKIGMNPEDISGEIIVLDKKEYTERFGNIKIKKVDKPTEITRHNLSSYFDDFFQQQYRRDKKEKDDDYFPTISDILNETPRYIKWKNKDEDDSKYVLYRGRPLTKSRMQEQEVLRTLEASGWRRDRLNGISEEELRDIKKQKKINKRIQKEKKKSEKKFDKFFYNRFGDVDDDNYRAFEEDYMNLSSKGRW